MSRSLFTTAALLLLFSCHKNDQQEMPPPGNKVYEVITTGSLFNPTNQHIEATCWINEKRQTMNAGNADQTFAYGIEKAGNDVYVSGGFAYTNPAEGNTLLMPCYWKNGQKIDLPTNELTVTQRCGAGDLRWFNNALYILGDADQLPLIWKIKNGLVSIIRMPQNDDVIDLRKTGNLQVYNNKLYIGGSQKKLKNGQVIFSPGYWQIDQDDKIDFHTVEDDLAYALCFSINVTAKGIVLAGESTDAAGQTVRPAVWSNQARHPVSGALNAAHHRLHTCVTDDNGNLYLNVLDIKSYQPVIWKASGGVPQLIKAAVPAAARGFCETLDILDNQLAYAYMYALNGQSYAAYVFRGKTVELDIYRQGLSQINRIRVFSK